MLKETAYPVVGISEIFRNTCAHDLKRGTLICFGQMHRTRNNGCVKCLKLFDPKYDACTGVYYVNSSPTPSGTKFVAVQLPLDGF